MKTVLLSLFLLTASLISCTPKVQVVTLESPAIKLQNKSFVYDTDSLRIDFNFQGENGLIRMNIYNKLDIPLYVDWKRSAFIRGTEKFDYWIDEAVFEGQYGGSSSNARYRWFCYQSGSFSGTIRKEEPIGFIPPKTEITQAKFVVAPGPAWHLSRKPTAVEEVNVPTASERLKKQQLIRFEFSEADSPLKFRNFLTLSTDSHFRTEFHIDTPFYASKVENVDGRYLFGSTFAPYDLNTPSRMTALPSSYQGKNQFLLKIPVN